MGCSFAPGPLLSLCLFPELRGTNPIGIASLHFFHIQRLPSPFGPHPRCLGVLGGMRFAARTTGPLFCKAKLGVWSKACLACIPGFAEQLRRAKLMILRNIILFRLRCLPFTFSFFCYAWLCGGNDQ